MLIYILGQIPNVVISANKDLLEQLLWVALEDGSQSGQGLRHCEKIPGLMGQHEDPVPGGGQQG